MLFTCCCSLSEFICAFSVLLLYWTELALNSNRCCEYFSFRIPFSSFHFQLWELLFALRSSIFFLWLLHCCFFIASCIRCNRPVYRWLHSMLKLDGNVDAHSRTMGSNSVCTRFSIHIPASGCKPKSSLGITSSGIWTVFTWTSFWIDYYFSLCCVFILFCWILYRQWNEAIRINRAWESISFECSIYVATIKSVWCKRYHHRFM